MLLSIWAVGKDQFMGNSAALTMVGITFFAIAARILMMVAQLLGGQVKIAIYAITTLGGIACLIAFLNEAKKLIDTVGRILGI